MTTFTVIYNPPLSVDFIFKVKLNITPSMVDLSEESAQYPIEHLIKEYKHYIEFEEDIKTLQEYLIKGISYIEI